MHGTALLISNIALDLWCPVHRIRLRAILRGRFSTPVLELDHGQCVPVGRKYRDAVRSAFDTAE